MVGVKLFSILSALPLAYGIYARLVSGTIIYGSYGIALIWGATVFDSWYCVRDLRSTVKWAGFSLVYLWSPFVYVFYYPLLAKAHINAYDVVGASYHWIWPGLFFMYLWWVLV